MDRYILTLLVTIEEEKAIQDLYRRKNWSYYKQDIKVNNHTNISGEDINPEEYSQPSAEHFKRQVFSKDENISSKIGREETGPEHFFGDKETLNNETLISDNIAFSNRSKAFSDNPDTKNGKVCCDGNSYTKNGKVCCDGNSDTKNGKVCFDGYPDTKNGKVCCDGNSEVDNKADHHSSAQTQSDNPILDHQIETKQYHKHSCIQDVTIKRQTRNSKNKIDHCDKKREMSKRVDVKLLMPEDSLKQNSKLGSFHCNECGITFKLLGSFNNHKRDGMCLFSCEYCGKVFTARYYYNYKIHLKYHKKERTHECDVCGKSYIEANALKIHKRKHSNNRPYVCDLCGRCFYSSSHLIYHKKSLHSETNEIHQCDLCGAVLSTLGNLRVHKQTVHVDDRPFTCEICGKAFKTKKALEQKHAKIHEDVFPFKCDFDGCVKSFKTSASLACHVRRHKNQRSHFCERCGKGFYNKKDLRLHTRVHTGEKPYSCKLCEYSCTLAGNLRKHLKTHDG